MAQQSDEAEQLREQLDELLRQARRNQEKMRLFSEQELLMIGMTSLQEFIAHLLYRLPTAFGLDSVSLLLCDPDHEVSRLLALGALPSLQVPELMVVHERGPLHGLQTPQLQAYRSDLHAVLFPGEHKPQSVALLPLLRAGRAIGSLHLGSHDPLRFTAESATDFLQHLTAIAAVCLENCLNHARLQQMGLTDPLTGVNNRRYFEQRLSEAHAAALRHRRPLACIFVDVDHFKRVNDSWGHPAGDEVLRTLARLVGGQLRHSDVLCRYGGEEFVILLPDTAREAAGEIAERIRRAVAAHGFDIPATVTVSAGVALLEQFDDKALRLDAPHLLAAADSALYRAKALGRNRVVIAIP